MIANQQAKRRLCQSGRPAKETRLVIINSAMVRDPSFGSLKVSTEEVYCSAAWNKSHVKTKSTHGPRLNEETMFVFVAEDKFKRKFPKQCFSNLESATNEYW